MQRIKIIKMETETRLELGAKSSCRHSTLKRPKVGKILEGVCLNYEDLIFYHLVTRPTVDAQRVCTGRRQKLHCNIYIIYISQRASRFCLQRNTVDLQDTNVLLNHPCRAKCLRHGMSYHYLLRTNAPPKGNGKSLHISATHRSCMMG
jgi:hypothetical protein